jgi:tyrosyl-tRNA synthetase
LNSGTDQKFNLLVGRDLQRAVGQEPQISITMQILVGTDGVQKMSKSLGNYIGITEPPAEMYGKLMSISDDMMWRYYELLTDVPMADIAKMKSDAMSGAAHPMTLKKELAGKIVADFHAADAATKASEDWAKQFQQGETPETLEEVSVSLSDVRGTASAESGEPLRLDKIIARAGLASSTTEANRKIKEKAVRVDGEVITTPVIYRGTLDDPAFRVVLVVRVGRQTKKVIISG